MSGREKQGNCQHAVFRMCTFFCIFAAFLGGICSLSACGKSREEDGPVILVYGTLHLEQEMETWISEYNLAQDEVEIEIREYGQEGLEEGLARLNAELVQGKGPDLIDLSNVNVGSYISLGILADIYPLLEADPDLQPEAFMPGELKLYETGGHLYGIAPGYRLETLMGERAVLGEPEDWTVEKMCGFIEALPQGSSFVNYLGSLGFLRIVLHRGMEEYVDWEAGTCSFDGDGFRGLLRLSAAMDTLPLFENEEQAFAQGKLLANRVYISGPEDYAASVSLFQGKPTVCVGFPSSEGGGALVTPYLPIGIRSGEKQDAGWKFVKSLLGNEFQEKHIRFNFPLRRDSLQKMLEEAAARSAENESGEETLRKEDCDALYEVIYSTGCSQVYDANIWEIVEEEAETCFEGDKSVEEAAGVIQSRAEIYVQENYAQGNSQDALSGGEEGGAIPEDGTLQKEGALREEEASPEEAGCSQYDYGGGVITDGSGTAMAAYEFFLAGSLLQFDVEDIRIWRLDTWRDTILPMGGLEYVYLDLDGDGAEELLVQYEDSPETYNGVFHYEDGRLYCWQNDAVEMTCRDYPLRDGTMVRQYDYGGIRSYTLFRYRDDGSGEKITDLYVREELMDPDSTEPCPYYEIGGREVDREEFEEQLKTLVTDQRLSSADWTDL